MNSKDALEDSLIRFGVWAGALLSLFFIDQVSAPSELVASVAAFLVFLLVCGFVVSLGDGLRLLERSGRAVAAVVLLSVGVASVVSIQTLQPLLHAILGGVALMAGGGLLGAAVGRHVRDPSHLWPLVIVAAAADLFSVFSAAGLTRAIVESRGPVTLSSVVLHAPVPGFGIVPLLGVGDVVFVAFLCSASAASGLRRSRTNGALLAAFALCGALVVSLGVALPALPLLGPLVALAHGREAAPRKSELAQALVFVGVFGVVALLARAVS